MNAYIEPIRGYIHVPCIVSTVVGIKLVVLVNTNSYQFF